MSNLPAVNGTSLSTTSGTAAASAAAYVPLERHEIAFVADISPSLQCPICYEVCTDPVITHVCHHSFCSACISRSLESEPYCPMCRRRLRKEDLHPNLALAGLISELAVYCPYKSQGCPSTVALDSLDHHARQCKYAPSACEMAKFGCGFHGTYQQVAAHTKADCPFARMAAYLEATERRIRVLEETMVAQQEEIGRLTVALARGGGLKPGEASGTTSPAGPLEGDGDEVMEEVESFPFGDIQCRRTIREHTCGVTSVTYHDGNIYSGAHDGSIKIFNAETGTHLRTLTDHRETVWSLSVDRARNRLYSASKDATIKVWDISRQRSNSTTMASPPTSPHQQPAAALPGPLATLTAHQGKIYGLALDAASNRLYSGSGDRTVRCWSLDTPTGVPECHLVLVGHDQGVNAVTLGGRAPVGDQGDLVGPATAVYTASNDKTVKVWDTATGQCVRTLPLAAEVLDVVEDPVSGLVFASTYDATISAFDPRVPASVTEPVAVLQGHNWEVWQLQVADGIVFSGSFDHSIKRWDPRTMSCTATLKGHRGFVHAMAIGHGCLISGCADRSIKIWS
ncbi:WD40-repeat-containing domain protein [Catenaria anguillulae PL171]|uniref:WD40-repeat-containing domain protein n=1 Tax=Catenaria anguillulae PL171 TaxID=765915 RepID=A0A1Y2HJU6_9FUNG|nr:WD40-repeat-containing domain protein [Catenaria anguillulae PL171]